MPDGRIYLSAFAAAACVAGQAVSAAAAPNGGDAPVPAPVPAAAPPQPALPAGTLPGVSWKAALDSVRRPETGEPMIVVTGRDQFSLPAAAAYADRLALRSPTVAGFGVNAESNASGVRLGVSLPLSAHFTVRASREGAYVPLTGSGRVDFVARPGQRPDSDVRAGRNGPTQFGLALKF